MSKCPSSIWHQDSNPQPFEHESSTITTMQGLSMLFLNVLPSSSCSHSFKGGKCVTFSTEQIIDIQIENRLPIGQSDTQYVHIFWAVTLVSESTKIKIGIEGQRSRIFLNGSMFFFTAYQTGQLMVTNSFLLLDRL